MPRNSESSAILFPAASVTTAPKPEGPGFPRAPPSQWAEIQSAAEDGAEPERALRGAAGCRSRAGVEGGGGKRLGGAGRDVISGLMLSRGAAWKICPPAYLSGTGPVYLGSCLT